MARRSPALPPHLEDQAARLHCALDRRLFDDPATGAVLHRWSEGRVMWPATKQRQTLLAVEYTAATREAAHRLYADDGHQWTAYGCKTPKVNGALRLSAVTTSVDTKYWRCHCTASPPSGARRTAAAARVDVPCCVRKKVVLTHREETDGAGD